MARYPADLLLEFGFPFMPHGGDPPEAKHLAGEGAGLELPEAFL